MLADILSNLVITGVNSVSNLYTPQGARLKRSDRPTWSLVIKYEGETTYICKEKRFLSDINHVVFLPSGCTYEWSCNKAGHFLTIEFEANLSFPSPFSVRVKNGERYLKMFKEMEYKRSLRRPNCELESIRDLYSVILSLIQSEAEGYLPSHKQKLLAPCMEYISRNYHSHVTNDQLAALAGISTVYFRKLFTETYGISPIAYIQQLRIEKAKEMLKTDYGSLSDMAQSLGYLTLYDFSRAFKKTVGVSPSKYAQSKTEQ